MKNSLIFDPTLSDEELHGFSRTVAEIEWLTVILVLLYQVVSAPAPEAAAALALGTLLFGAFVLGFHYLNFYRKETNWKLALETWAMIGFITWVLALTDGLSSPLANAYLLPVITAALTLGKPTPLFRLPAHAAGSSTWSPTGDHTKFVVIDAPNAKGQMSN